MTYRDAIDFLFPLHRFGIKPGLERVSELLQAAGDPQKKLGRVVHIAGTNGKGTVACALAAIFHAAGYRTGLYTSPHLVSFTERIRVDGKAIPEPRVAAYCTALQEAIVACRSTFFEATTAIAFWYFSEMQTDISIIETGMGGRLDATNVVDPDFIVIPSIGKDHTGWLGDTVEKIAAEKAAIIKKNARVYTAVTEKDALLPIFEKAGAVGAKVSVLSDTADCVVHSSAVGRLVFSLRTGGFEISNLEAAVTGSFHASNLALAVLVARDAGIEERAIREGLLALQEHGYRARLERLSSKPDILLDVAHNPDAIRKSVDVLLGLRDGYRQVVVLLGVVRDKDAREMVRRLKPLTDTIVTANMATERGLSSSALGELCRKEGFLVTVAETVENALDRAHNLVTEDDLLLITGSFYLAGEVLQLAGGIEQQ